MDRPSMLSTDRVAEGGAGVGGGGGTSRASALLAPSEGVGEMPFDGVAG